jgi:hypothetical protein
MDALTPSPGYLRLSAAFLMIQDDLFDLPESREVTNKIISYLFASAVFEANVHLFKGKALSVGLNGLRTLLFATLIKHSIESFLLQLNELTVILFAESLVRFLGSPELFPINNFVNKLFL